MRHAVLTVPTLVAIAALGGATSAVPAAAQATAVVASITDGDTLRLTSGMRVRLLQIDAPEVGTGECHSRASRTALLARVPVGSRIVLERDHGPGHGRPLRAPAPVREARDDERERRARPGGRRGSVLLPGRARDVRRQAPGRGDTGAGGQARALGRLSAHGARSDEARVETGRSGPSGASGGVVGIIGSGGGGRCDPSYPGVCIAPPPPDLDCAEVPYRGFRVRAPDPHGFDGDRDGVGCEH